MVSLGAFESLSQMDSADLCLIFDLDIPGSGNECVDWDCLIGYVGMV